VKRRHVMAFDVAVAVHTVGGPKVETTRKTHQTRIRRKMLGNLFLAQAVIPFASEVATLKQASLCRLTIEIVDIRNILDILDEVSGLDTGADRLRDGSYPWAVIDKLLQDQQIPRTALGRGSLIIGVMRGQVVSLAANTVGVAKLWSTNLWRGLRR
jgi:hypothetical protein